MLVDMQTAHVAVLAGELVAALDPRPGDVAVDCTFGGGGHARLGAEGPGPDGEPTGTDRDPAAQERFAGLADELPLRARFIRAPVAAALEQLLEEDVRADVML